MKNTFTGKPAYRLITVLLLVCFMVTLISACSGGMSGNAGVLSGGGANTAGTDSSGKAQNGSITAMPLSGGNLKPDELYLHVGSPIALSDGKILPLDKDDPGVAAMVYKNRTLVPLRFVSEFFGAAVSYDEAAKAGVVKTDSHTAAFPVGESYFTLDGQRIELDAETQLAGGRIMLPLRALCEQVLGLTVDYSNGVIQIAEDSSITSGVESEVKSKIGMYVKTSDLDALNRYLEEFGSGRGYNYYYYGDVVEVDEEIAMMEDANVPMRAPADTPSGATAGATADGAPGAAPPPAEAPVPMPSTSPGAAPQPGIDLGVNDSAASEPEASFNTSDAKDDEGSASSEGGHSSTNTQVVGIDEADIIKTDGKYIYLLGSSSARIISASGEMSAVAKINLPNAYLADMYIDDGRLIVIGSRWNDTIAYGAPPPTTEKPQRAASDDIDMPEPAVDSIVPSEVPVIEQPEPDVAYTMPYRGRNTTFVNIYDTTDMSDIKLLRSFEVEGDMLTTRKQNGYLYLLTTLYHRYDSMDPRPYAGEDGKIAPIPLECIMISPGCYTEGFLTLSAINVFDAQEEVASETITTGGYASTQYMSSNAMYIASHDYFSGDGVSIAKFTISGGRVGYAGSGSVRGSLNDQFSMDEHRGYLRIATTSWDNVSKNNLFVLDGNMHVCGSVLGFAPEERIYSARFMGDRGYIVTFRQIDPLFVFDLSDPVNPKITGELKVPGFSSYLHPVSENVILGVGNDVYDIYTRDKNGKETVVGQRTGGIKLSLFDVSDMGKPKEIDSLILGDSGYAELLYNHKAAMFKQDDGILAFCADLYGDTKADWFNGALIISYVGNTLSERGRISSSQSKGDSIYYGESSDFYNQRLVYIGDILYYAENGVVRSFDINTLTLKQSLRLW